MDSEREIQLERYLAGALTEAEIAALMAQIPDDPQAMQWLGTSLLQQELLVDCLAARVAHGGSGDPDRVAQIKAPATSGPRHPDPQRLRRLPGHTRWWLSAAALVVASLLTIGAWWSSRPILLGDLSGEAVLIRGRQRLPGDTQVRSGDAIEASGPAMLTLAAQQGEIACAGATRLDLRSEGSARSLDLARGRCVVHIAHQLPGHSWLVRTPQASLTIIGTRFVVEAGADATSLEVREGQVAAAHADGTGGIRVNQGLYVRVMPKAPLIAHAQAPAIDLVQGLVGWWPMDEGAGGQVVDACGLTLPGRIIHAAWVPGRFGSALSFDGQFGGSTVDLGWHDLGRLPGLTLSAWVKTTSDQYGSVFSGGFVIGSGSWTKDLPRTLTPAEIAAVAGRVGFEGAVDPGHGPLRSHRRIDDGTWHHVLWWWRADGQRRIYIDGTLDVEQQDVAQKDRSWDRWYWAIGAGSDRLVWNFGGLIDELRIYRRALSPSEISALAGRPASP